jgi:hypothetical protein
MSFEIISNIDLPETRRTRSRGEFATAVDSLEVGQGFYFSDKRPTKALYPTVAPKKFGGKKFAIRLVEEAGEDGLNKYAVKRTA